MVTIIHGDNELQVRRELQIIKEKNTNKDIVILTKPDALTLRQNVASDSMFESNKVVIIEQMLEKGIASEVVAFLGTNTSSIDCVFVERRQLDRDSTSHKLVDREAQTESASIGIGKGERSKGKTTQLLKGKKLLDTFKKQIPTIRIIVCNDYSLFNFLDALLPGNSKKIIADYQTLIDNGYAGEEIYYMVVDHVRYLVIANDLGVKGLVGMHQFRQSKIVSQAKRFSQKQIVSIYKKLFEVEVAQKLKRVGEGSPFSMEEDLRFFLSTAFAK